MVIPQKTRSIGGVGPQNAIENALKIGINYVFLKTQFQYLIWVIILVVIAFIVIVPHCQGHYSVFISTPFLISQTSLFQFSLIVLIQNEIHYPVAACDVPLGMESGKIKDSQVTASSVHGARYEHQPSSARLHNQRGHWRPARHSSGEWLQVDFIDPVAVTKVATQG